MSIDWFQDVKDFHRKFDCYTGMFPHVPDKDTVELRQEIVREEYQELFEAMICDNLTEIADAICDLIYVAIGTAVSYGIDIRPIWDAIHESNMAKVGGGKREDGKILKPEGWKPPPVMELLSLQKPKIR